MNEPKPVYDGNEGVLRNAASHGSSTSAGNKAIYVSLRWPQTTLVTTPSAQFILNVTPLPLDRRVITLQTDAEVASGITLSLSYEYNSVESQPSPTPRELFAAISFGNGGARQYIEVDVAEGTTVSLHTQTAEVDLYLESPQPPGAPPPPPLRWNANVAAAYSALDNPGVRTQQAFLPLLVGGPQPSAGPRASFAHGPSDSAAGLSEVLREYQPTTGNEIEALARALTDLPQRFPPSAIEGHRNG